MVATESGRIAGVEALARWRLNGADVPTDVFIRIAEDTGMVVQLGMLVLDTVVHDAPAIRAAAGGPISVSVNISAAPASRARLRHERAARRRADAAGRAGPGDHRAAADRRRPDVLEAMRAIGAMGVRFAIDDFGIGFSSISYLQDLPVHIIKADARFGEHRPRRGSCAVLLPSP